VAELGAGLAAANAEYHDGTSAAEYAQAVTEWENRNLLTVGYAAAIAANNRCESRGAHTRQDYPTHNPTIAHSIAYVMA
ncbi:MAG TPA: L-aspartate oxidase, partial [Bifidobacterium sp.]|nr:L-aspartate oxidase [Bifidobacterium sp.]